MPNIFISYRRDDSKQFCRSLFDELAKRFGREQIVMDVDSIFPGTRFPKEIERFIRESDVILAVIGPRWAGQDDDGGEAREARRIDNPGDFVRIEIGLALQESVPIIPILLDGAAFPPLPEDIAALETQNGLLISSDADLQQNMERIARAVEVQSHVKERQLEQIERQRILQLGQERQVELARIEQERQTLLARAEQEKQARVAAQSREKRLDRRIFIGDVLGLIIGTNVGIALGSILGNDPDGIDGKAVVIGALVGTCAGGLLAGAIGDPFLTALRTVIRLRPIFVRAGDGLGAFGAFAGFCMGGALGIWAALLLGPLTETGVGAIEALLFGVLTGILGIHVGAFLGNAAEKVLQEKIIPHGRRQIGAFFRRLISPRTYHPRNLTPRNFAGLLLGLLIGAAGAGLGYLLGRYTGLVIEYVVRAVIDGANGITDPGVIPITIGDTLGGIVGAAVAGSVALVVGIVDGIELVQRGTSKRSETVEAVGTRAEEPARR